MPPGKALDAETILAATEQVLRRHGPEKATVVDVARALGVSHTAVYKHFGSKNELHEAVTRRWSNRANDGLDAVIRDPGLTPPERLRAWFVALIASKRARVAEDPELFATYRTLAAEHSHVATQHVDDLVGRLRGVIAEGIASGDFAASDPERAARAVFRATIGLHHPDLVDFWTSPEADAALEEVCGLILDGLRSR